ncbi:hypothetical protein LOC68_09050 [Blastopirellula sp. JC732]|uniref:Lipoprotein n=1 Tax=Blastopirellula sediminis TaxID=2894196 RepID=A0A9X1SG47_9BACT|nr:hypothetical protein [Blastopirellula sediminis]MCC9608681.1 hypothetical protein [Blastopirellula sediminis]MCC9628542.1 hypothetical protein [Blastopirellula sediminis]
MIRIDSSPIQTALVLTILGALLLGCRGSAEPMVDAPSAAVEQFVDAGKMWLKQDTFSEEDQANLARFFHSHPNWRDSTELEGTPVVYATEKQRRYYWIRPAQDQPIWTCLHFENKRFRITNGAGPLGSSAD